MQVISSERRWRDPFEKIAVYSAVDRCSTKFVLSGETDDEALNASASKTVRRTEWAIACLIIRSGHAEAAENVRRVRDTPRATRG